MSEYSDLQKEAAGLGLKSVGVSKKNLIESIKNAKNEDVDRSKPEEEAPEVEKGKDEKKVNAAIVSNKGHEVRRYTAEIHGEDFAELAKEFIKNREGYKIKLTEVKAGKICPDCGSTSYA